MEEKPLIWVGGSRNDVRGFPETARRRAGYELHQIQLGLAPSDWKPVTNIGPGVRELRIQTAGAFRVMYLATLPEAIYVLHALERKTRRTSNPDIALARQRYSTVIANREER